MNLYVFPAYPGNSNGYEIAVKSDIEHFAPDKNDKVIFFAQHKKDLPYPCVIDRKKGRRLRALKNAFRLAPFSEVSSEEIAKKIADMSFDRIICGEVIFYRALRKLFPDKELIVRYHNFYAILFYTIPMKSIKLSLKFLYTVVSSARLEKEILGDNNCLHYFITQEEASYAKIAAPGITAQALELRLDYSPQRRASGEFKKANLILFGSLLAAHTKVGVDFFIRNIYLRKNLHLKYDLHLFGKGTEQYTRAEKRITGHGYYNGSGLPLDGNGLYLVPDLHGLGIKLKVADLLRYGATVLATPESLHGYPEAVREKVHVVDLCQWDSAIEAIMRERLRS